MDMNPAMEMDVPDGTEDTGSKAVSAIDENDQKFIDLAKKMKRLSPETLAMIEKDLQPEDKKEMDTESSKEEGDEYPESKSDCKDCNPPSKDPRAMLIIGLKKVLSQV